MNASTTQNLIDLTASWTPGQRLQAHLTLLANPPLIDLEPVSTCNLVCSFCPRERIHRQVRFMRPGTFEAVLAWLPKNATVMLAGLGEPTLHPALPAWVRRLTRLGTPTCLVTNGTRLDTPLLDALVDAGIAQVQVSLHDIPRSLETPHQDLKRNPAGIHLQPLVRHARRGLRVRINFVESEDNRDAAPRVEAFAREHGFSFFWRRRHNRGGHAHSPRTAPRPPGCGIFPSVTFVTVDGVILPCANDAAARHPLGSVHDLPWARIIAHKTRIITHANWFEVCTRCDDDYRWVLLAQQGLDEPAHLPGTAAPHPGAGDLTHEALEPHAEWMARTALGHEETDPQGDETGRLPPRVTVPDGGNRIARSVRPLPP